MSKRSLIAHSMLYSLCLFGNQLAHAQTSIVPASDLNGSSGFKINGQAQPHELGVVSGRAADINGDGIADLIIGAPGANPNGAASGRSYVLFGKAGNFSAQIEDAGLNGNNGFAINGQAADDRAGSAVSAAGDLNGDGMGDIVVGANGANANNSGRSYVVFGRTNGFPATIALASLNGSNGFALNGEFTDDGSGISVARAGNINNDGIDDVIIGANAADPNGGSSGRSYVVFGRSTGFPAALDLIGLDGSAGFMIDGAVSGSNAGRSVSAAGDVNGDGIDDLIIGAPNGDRQDSVRSGLAHVVFGRSTAFASPVRLSALNAADGFTIEGEAAGDNFGGVVADAGDFNGDGIDDLLIGAANADPSGQSSAGRGYVIFGRTSGFPSILSATSINTVTGVVLDGVAELDRAGGALGGLGDINGDGFDDIGIGAPGVNLGNIEPGRAYVVYGRRAPFEAPLALASLDGNSGFAMDGESNGDRFGASINGAGDVNADGTDDIVVGANLADPNGDRSGRAYVFFGIRQGIFVDSFEQ